MEGDRPACRRRAMDLLSRREHSRRELARKLEARSFPADVISEVLDALEREGLLSAERFAESFVAARHARGQGPERIRRELVERGIESPDVWLHDERFDWTRLAREVRRKRFGESLPADFPDKARQARFLEYRGFGQQQIRAALEFDED
jgi:regulatory protein